MKTQREILEGEKVRFEGKLQDLRAYIKELTDRTAEHDSEDEHFEEDLMKAEHDAEYYENEIESLEKMIRPAPTAKLKLIAKQGRVSIIVSSIAFLVGAYLGSRLIPRNSQRE